MQRGRVWLCLEVDTDLVEAAGNLQIIDHCTDMEAGTAHQYAAGTPFVKIRQDGHTARLEFRDRELLARIHDVEKVVSNLGPLLRRGCCGANVHSAVDLHGVHRHQLDTGTPSSSLHSQCRLARGGGADKHQVPVGSRHSRQAARAQADATGIRRR